MPQNRFSGKTSKAPCSIMQETEQLYRPSPAPTGAEDLGASLHLSSMMFISSVEQAIFME